MEVNVDGLVGPTHNYAGLSFGNVASTRNKTEASNPKAAALQGLEKMKALHDLGIPQMVMPPHPRPFYPVLKELGLTGSHHEVLATLRGSPALLATFSSASAMWAANAATVAPSADTADGRVHFTPANLQFALHRSIESVTTSKHLQRLFPSEEHFVHHAPLHAHPHFADEGAANHTRLCETHEKRGLHLFVYGRDPSAPNGQVPKIYPARQSRLACEAVARLHQLAPENTLFVQQNPDMIDAGVFHNDVISVGNERVLFYHEDAFVGNERVIDTLRERLGECFVPVCVGRDEVTPEQAVNSYLFNSQLVTLPNGEMAIVAPTECRENESVQALLARVVADPANPISAVHILDVRESMRNGGGPACLRLRVALTDEEWNHVYQPAVFTHALHQRLSSWVERHYRDRLVAEDLFDPQFTIEVEQALQELSDIV